MKTAIGEILARASEKITKCTPDDPDFESGCCSACDASVSWKDGVIPDAYEDRLCENCVYDELRAHRTALAVARADINTLIDEGSRQGRLMSNMVAINQNSFRDNCPVCLTNIWGRGPAHTPACHFEDTMRKATE